MGFVEQYLEEAGRIVAAIAPGDVEQLAQLLAELRRPGGRLFVLGSGGGAGHASHAVCDFRKLAAIEAYAPTDNVSELTARVNDEGWETSYREWLKVSRLSAKDMLLVFSVGGGDLERNISPNLVRAVEHAREVGCSIGAVVGRDGGYAGRVAQARVVRPTLKPAPATATTPTLHALSL